MDERSGRSTDMVVEHDLELIVRDGTILRADSYRPRGDGTFPTLLCRTPYDKTTMADAGRRLAQRGYLVVIGDVRGRFASDGEFRPGFFSADHSDTEDGYDTVEWAASLPASNGRVGTFGASYDGWTQWELAHARPPSLVAAMPGAIAANLLDRELSGVLRLGRVLFWTVNNLSVESARRLGDARKARTREEVERHWVERDRFKWLWYLPLMEIPEEAMPGMAEHWRRWLDDHASDHFGFLEKHRDIDIPVLSLTGWYDQQIGTIGHFTGMVQNGRTEHARQNQRLIVGPWTHDFDELGRQVGEVDFGPDAARDYYAIADAWFGRWLRDEQTEAAEWPPIQLFVMGANRWRAEQEWPLARTRYADYYLRRGDDGVGLLSPVPPADEAADRYDYDPRDPLMTLFSPNGQQAPIDQRALDGRADVVHFATPALSDPVEVTGPITLRLWASSSAPDTDFVAKLIDVWPDGFAQELCHGIVRARYRESFTEPTLLRPGEPTELTIDINPTSNLFGIGHRIRLDISSSDFPNFDRNHNTGGDDYRESTLEVAQQMILHDRQHPSRLTLPLIPSDPA